MKVQEKMKTYGSNTLTDSELISLIIGKRVKDRTAVEVADKVMESLPRQNLYYLGGNVRTRFGSHLRCRGKERPCLMCGY